MKLHLFNFAVRMTFNNPAHFVLDRRTVKVIGLIGILLLALLMLRFNLSNQSSFLAVSTIESHNFTLLQLSVASTETVAFYSKNADFFCNKCDFDFYKKFLPTLSCCNDKNSIIITGGVNEGAMIDLLLDVCPKPVIHGFEIQNKLYETLLLKYSLLQRVRLYNLGFSDKSTKEASINGNNEMAGLYRTFQDQSPKNETVSTVSLAEFVEDKGNVCFSVIDVEGFESKVIQGMGLKENLKHFKIFAFELGGTWADSRNPSSWRQQDACAYLENNGYNLYIIGKTNLMRVSRQFFAESKHFNDGSGYFVQGNLLAIHNSVKLK